MFWNKKEEGKGLPNLPPSNTPPMINEAHEDHEDPEDMEKHGLPAFPDSPMQRGFSQSAIKEAVHNESTDEPEQVGFSPKTDASLKTVEVNDFSGGQSNIPSLPSIPGQAKATSEMNSPIPAMHSSSMQTLETPSKPKSESVMPPASFTPIQPQETMPKTRQSKDVFIKIDKFYGAKKALNTANEQLEDIDVLLKKIRETKQKEEQELAAWEKELATIKSRIKDVSTSIFEKIE